MKRKNGFTLIELLAVIIILGILMIIAIPSVTQYINNSRKSAYIDTAREIISGARNFVNEGKLEMFSTDTTYYIPISCISTENGSKSPYGDFDQAYVLVTYDGSGYKYYWVSRDVTGQGVPDPTLAADLDEDDIDSDISFDYIKTNVKKDGTSKVEVLNNSCSSFEEFVQPVCKRVESTSNLHTEPCESGKKCTLNHAANSTITYGSVWDGSSALQTGDAFDCDVNGDGNYTERFYYLSDYFDTQSLTFDSSTAVLIYYSTTDYQGHPNISTPVFANSGENKYGPVSLLQSMPKDTEWTNISLKKTERSILAESTSSHNLTSTSGGALPTNFSYAGKSARIPTGQEIMHGCDIPSLGRNNNGAEIIPKCEFLLEQTAYTSISLASVINGIWLETPVSTSSSSVWYVDAYGTGYTDQCSADNASYSGVKPVIEVSKTDLR